MVCLLDVNVLVALLDPAHVHHDRAHAWFSAVGHVAWASCPLTENGVLRIIGHARYPNSPGSPAAVAPLLAQLCSLRGHVFWADTVSLQGNGNGDVDSARLLDSAQITDTYLLALACAHHARLASFDRRLSSDAVRGGRQALLLIG